MTCPTQSRWSTQAGKEQQMSWNQIGTWPYLNIKTAFPGMGISIIKIMMAMRHLIFIMEFLQWYDDIFTLRWAPGFQTPSHLFNCTHGITWTIHCDIHLTHWLLGGMAVILKVWFSLIRQVINLSTCCEFALMRMPQNITCEKSTLVQGMVCCYQVKSPYLSQKLTQIYVTICCHKAAMG